LGRPDIRAYGELILTGQLHRPDERVDGSHCEYIEHDGGDGCVCECGTWSTQNR